MISGLKGSGVKDLTQYLIDQVSIGCLTADVNDTVIKKH